MVAMIFLTLLYFFFLGDVMWHHSDKYCLDCFIVVYLGFITCDNL